jgi:hypothetical protein
VALKDIPSAPSPKGSKRSAVAAVGRFLIEAGIEAKDEEL